MDHSRGRGGLGDRSAGVSATNRSVRQAGTPAQDRCHAKTGTLRDTSSLAGVCAVSSGRTLYFAFHANGVSTYYAKLRENRMAVRLAGAAGTPATPVARR